MEAFGDAASSGAELLRLLIFSAGGLRFGADADQIAALGACDPRHPPPHAVPLQRALGFGEEYAPHSPETCTIRRGGEACTFIIEAPDDLVCVETRLVRPLPPLVETAVLKRGIWAALPGEETMVLVVDLHRLAAHGNLWHPQGDFS